MMERRKTRGTKQEAGNRKQGFMLLASCFLLLLELTPVFSLDPDEAQIDVKADVIEYLREGELLVGKGNVVVTYKGTRLEASEVSVQVDTRIAVCKGHAVVYEEGMVYEGENLVYDFTRHTGQASDARVKAPPIFAGGERVERKETGEFEVENGYITTCNLDEPHYKITTKHITLEPGDRVIAHNAVIWAGPVPVLYVPSYTHSVKGKKPKVSTVGGRRKEWGAFLLTDWSYEWSPAMGGDFLLDERTDLGQGYGTTMDYRFSSFGDGHSKVYYTQERNRNLPEGTPAEKQRYQTSLRHDWEISPRTRTFFEFNKRSDPGFVKDYFEREHEKENNPETHWDLTHHTGAGSAEIYIRQRANRFEDVTERLPELRWHTNSSRLMKTPLYYTSDLAFASFQKKDASEGTSNDVFRSDFLNRIEFPFRFRKWLSVDPHAGVRQTAYSRGTTKNEVLNRGIFFAGVDFNSRFSRIYENPVSFLPASPLRHVVSPQVSYEYRASPTVSRSQLIEIGEPDTLNRASQLTLGLEQKLQTKQMDPAGDSGIRDLARLLITGGYDFETERGGEAAPSEADLELRLREGLLFDADLQYDPPSKDFLRLNLDLRWTPPEGPQWIFGHRYLQNSSVQETVEIKTHLGQKWDLRVYERFNVKSFRETGAKRINDFIEQEYTLVRDLHCWEMELSYNVESGHEFWISFRLKQFADSPFSLKQKAYSPSPGAI